MTTTPQSRSTGARDKMVQGAVDQFRRRGVAGTALSDIVERSGAPRGSVYHYFPGGKAQLATEATESAGRLYAGALTLLLSAQGPGGALATVVQVFRSQLVESGFTAGCPVAAGALEGGEAPEARTAAGEAFAMWEAALATALWQRGLARDRAEGVATLAISAVEGALVLAKAQRDTRALDRVERELAVLVAAVLPGVGASAE